MKCTLRVVKLRNALSITVMQNHSVLCQLANTKPENVLYQNTYYNCSATFQLYWYNLVDFGWTVYTTDHLPCKLNL